MDERTNRRSELKEKMETIIKSAEPGKAITIPKEIALMEHVELIRDVGYEIQELDKWRADSYHKAKDSTVKLY